VACRHRLAGVAVLRLISPRGCALRSLSQVRLGGVLHLDLFVPDSHDASVLLDHVLPVQPDGLGWDFAPFERSLIPIVHLFAVPLELVAAACLGTVIAEYRRMPIFPV
jgi:hypothetical protein